VDARPPLSSGARSRRTRPLSLSDRALLADCPPPEGVCPEQWRLHLRLQHRPTPDVLERLVEEHRGMTLGLARRWHRHGEALEDLEQVAFEALVTALRRFECERRLPFTAFAAPTIVGALKRHYRDQGWALRVPRVVHELASPVRAAADTCRARSGTPPTRSQVAEELGVQEETVGFVQQAMEARSSLSLDAPHTPGGQGGWDLPSDEDAVESTTDVIALVDALQALDARSRQLLGMYYFGGLTQSQIAERFGVSQMQVSRWLASTLRRLRTRTGATDGHIPKAVAS
jgi:RNA polymerase sigma-B factor